MDMKNIDALCNEHGISYAELERAIGAGNGVIRRWGTSVKGPQSDLLIKVAEHFNVSLDYVCGRTNNRNQNIYTAPSVTKDYVTFPIIGEVAAGYEHIAYESWDNGNIDIPESWLCGKAKEDFFVLEVRGGSMYPDYQDGDIVLVHRQSDTDYSGQVAIVIYNDENGSLKKVEYNPERTWVKLSPINKQYEPILIKGEGLDHFEIIGVPKKLIRDISI